MTQGKKLNAEPGSMQPPYDESHARAVADLFDASYYLATNLDVAESGVDPLIHFVTIGWREGRNPSPDFDVTYYQRTNPDVAAIGLNPLVHYAWSGAREGRLPCRPLDRLRKELEIAQSPRVRAKEWAGAADQSPTVDCQSLVRILASAVAGHTALIVSVSHDDYDRNLGGVQNVIREERIAFERMDCAYLHLSPAAPLPMMAEPTSAGSFRFVLRLGPDRLGVSEADDIISSLGELRSDETPLVLIVHHFMGHSPEALLRLAELSTEPAIVWAHDYFDLCSSHNLLRNNIQFCGAPPVTSGACGICVYGAERVAHLQRLKGFFEAARPVVLAPSEAALNLWCRRGNLPYREAHVYPLARLVLAPDQMELTPVGPTRPLRVAHLGMRTTHKGWPVFEQLALCLRDEPAYRFYQLGIQHGAPLPGCVRHVHVQVSRDHPDSMVEAIAEHNIDVVVSWSPWPETFCFAVYEALAGGAFVLTHANTGNVPRIIAQCAPEQGHVLEDQGSLFDLFESGRIRTMLSTASRRRGVIIPGSGAASWLDCKLGRMIMSGSEKSFLKFNETSAMVAVNA